jgi:large subunit ribosomal protein L31e
MAETKITQREYVIPLRRTILKVPKYKRTGRAIKTIKQFVAKHMKVPDRDLKKVKLDVYFNNQIWFRGRTNPPAKVKVNVKKDGDNILVDFVEIPQDIKYLKKKHERFHKKPEKKKSAPAEKKDEKTEEEKKEEKEKAQSTAEAAEKSFEKEAKTQKHTTSSKTPQVHRKALKK